MVPPARNYHPLRSRPVRYRLYPEVASSVLGGNDMVMHLLLADAVVEAITQGRNFTDPWQGTMGMGFPLAH